MNILEELKNLKITSDINDLINSDVYIITVPTPIDKSKRPNLNLVRSAILKICESINKSLEQNQNNCRNDNFFTVILESTVYQEVVKIFVFQ